MTCGNFMKDGARAHTVNYPIKVLNEVFKDIVISHSLWSERSPVLNNPCGLYLWGNLKNKVQISPFYKRSISEFLLQRSLFICACFSLNELLSRYDEQLTFVRVFFFVFFLGGEMHTQHLGR
jgi:hypothetical protein